MSYIDPASSCKVITLFTIARAPALTYSPSYSAPTFTQSFDVRPYMRAMLILVVEECETGVTLDVQIQQSAGDAFDTWTASQTTAAADADFVQVTPSNDNQIYTCSVDLSKTQNALGIEAVVASGGNRVTFGVYAILFPYDTSNATSPDMEI